MLNSDTSASNEIDLDRKEKENKKSPRIHRRTGARQELIKNLAEGGQSDQYGANLLVQPPSSSLVHKHNCPPPRHPSLPMRGEPPAVRDAIISLASASSTIFMSQMSRITPDPVSKASHRGREDLAHSTLTSQEGRRGGGAEGTKEGQSTIMFVLIQLELAWESGPPHVQKHRRLPNHPSAHQKFPCPRRE